MDKPSVFIGSSAEALNIARHLQTALEKVAGCEATVWDQDVFTPSAHAMESLLEAANSSDFAVLVATPDDLTESRGKSAVSPRDNVLFELGLFMGVLGVRRVFILCPESAEAIRLPSDLHGLTRLPDYRTRSDGNLLAALNTAALAAKKAMDRLGARRPLAPLPAEAEHAVPSLAPRPLPRYGLDSMLVNSRPGRFAQVNENRPALHLRAVWRPGVVGEQLERLEDPASFTSTVPTGLLDRWHDYYATHGGVGQPQDPQLDGPAIYDSFFVAGQDCLRWEVDEPQASVRSAIALLDGGPSLRFLVDLSLSAPAGRLPLDEVMASLYDMARHASAVLPNWLEPRLPTALPSTGILELHAQGCGALSMSGTRDSLDSYLDLSLLGRRSRPVPINASWAGRVDVTDDEALRSCVVAVFADSKTNWGYLAPPADLKYQLAKMVGIG